jgi:hypothetical protein
VVSPESLTREIAKQIEAARTQYIEQSPAP